MTGYTEIAGGRIPIRAWVDGVSVEAQAEQQLRNVSMLPIVEGIAVMPDVHFGIGCTVGSVIATKGAIVPASVGVDGGCGMLAVRTNLTAGQLPDKLKPLRHAIERDVPVGKDSHKETPKEASRLWTRNGLDEGFAWLEANYKGVIGKIQPLNQIGTLGGGNHFIELCLDETERVWIMLHSGSRGIGNRVGQHFIAAAQKRCANDGIALSDRDLAYLVEGTPEFDDYVTAIGWVQNYAATNRQAMLDAIVKALRKHLPHLLLTEKVVQCHHNYVEREMHSDVELWITRKGAVSARKGQTAIIPGSMGTRSYIVCGLGNPDSYHSCSHGAGRVMSRGMAKQLINLDDHIADTAHVECRKDLKVIDESPRAYKDIEKVIAAQADLITVEHTLVQVLCVKG